MNKILIVEDDISIAEIEKDYLEKDGYKVSIEHDGLDALDRIKSEPFDLFILDIMLPGKDGFEICQEIRKVQNTPIIMVSAKKEEMDKIKGLNIGADDYITKPFSPREMVARVNAHISRYERLVGAGNELTNNNIIQIGKIKITKQHRQVLIDNKEISFTVKEYDVLLFLIANTNKVLTKEEIFKAVWGMDAVGDLATVTVHVQKVREKIEKNSDGTKYIETIWGYGYRFKVE